MATRGEKLVDGLIGTAVWSVPEMFGVKAPQYVEEFKQDNPVLGFGASMAVEAIPYAGWFAATKKIKRLDDIIMGIGDASKAPIATGALREAARFAPFEAARALGGLTIGDQGFDEAMGQAAINTALAGAAGGVIGFLGAAGKRVPKITEELPDLQTQDPPQLQLRALSKRMPTIQTGTQDPAPGFQRFFHGADDVAAAAPTTGGSRWVTTDAEYARKFRSMGTDKKVYYVDIPKGDPAEVAGRLWDDADELHGINNVGTYKHMEVPEEWAQRMQPYQTPGQAPMPGPINDPTLAAVNRRSVDLRQLVRTEDPIDQQYVTTLAGRGDAGKLNRLFKDSEAGGLTKRQTTSQKFVEAEGHFGSEREWKSYLGANGINPVDFESYAQYPRRLAAKSEPAWNKLQNTIRENMEDVGEGWYMAREAEDGMYLLAKKNDGDASFTTFKTDSPDFFRDVPAQFGSAGVKAQAWTQDGAQLFKEAGPVFKALSEYSSRITPRTYQLLGDDAAREAGQSMGMIDRIRSLSGLQGKELPFADSELIARVRDGFKEYFTPTMFQTKGSPRATYTLATARMLKDTAESLAQRRLYGTIELDKSKNLMTLSLESNRANKSDGLATFLDSTLTDADMKALSDIYRYETPPERLMQMYAEGKISEGAMKATQRLYKEFDEMAADNLAVDKALGLNDFKKRKNYLGIARDWDGDLRIEVVDKAGRTRGVASGYNNRDAESNLRTMLERHPDWSVGRRFNLSEQAANPVTNGAAIPRWARPRQGIEGYRFNYKDFTKKEFIEEITANVRSRYQRQANLAIEHGLRNEVARLQLDDPLMHRIVTTRLNDFMGKQRPFATAVNKITDRILGPVMGTNSASQITAVTNNLMWNLELGGFRLGYIISNVLTPLQTSLPEIAYMMNSAPGRVADHYTYFAAMGQNGPVGTIGALDPIKLMGRAVKSMRTPSPMMQENFQRAVNDLVIDPQVVEEFFGESATKVGDWKKAISGVSGFTDWTKAVWQYLPAQSERFSRAYSFVVGHHVATDLLGIIDPEEAYRLARQFTSRTMYEYTQADRASIITGPVGGMFGLFKNWMMHYVGQMMEYTGEGVKHGNWAPLLWQQGSTLALGGVAASPLYAIASEANDWMSNKTLMENGYAAMGQEGADGLFYGLPALMGMSMSGQVSSPLANPIRDAGMMFSAVHMDRMSYMAKAFGAAMDNFSATGEHPAASEHVREMMVRAFAPKTIYRIVQAMGDSGIESLQTGYPILKNPGMLDRVMFAMGMNPTEIDRMYAVADMLYEDQDKRRALVAATAIAYNEAIERRDSKEAWMVLRGAMKQGLDPGSVMKSAAARNQAGNERMLERTFSPENVFRFKQVLGQ